MLGRLRSVMTSRPVVWALVALVSVASACTSSGRHRGSNDHTSPTRRSGATSHDNYIHGSGLAGIAQARLLPAGRTRGGPHVIAHAQPGQPITVTANLVPTTTR